MLAATRRDGDAVEIVVEDDGPGMSEAVQRRIFDAFFTTKGPDAGTGLGLPIAWDIVREHGGWMEAHSRPGEGARFSVRLPAASAADPTSPTDPTDPVDPEAGTGPATRS